MFIYFPGTIHTNQELYCNWVSQRFPSAVPEEFVFKEMELKFIDKRTAINKQQKEKKSVRQQTIADMCQAGRTEHQSSQSLKCFLKVFYVWQNIPRVSRLHIYTYLHLYVNIIHIHSCLRDVKVMIEDTHVYEMKWFINNNQPINIEYRSKTV